MKVEIEDFKTGWYGINLGLKTSQIDDLIKGLESLKKTKSHFHYRSDFSGEGGVGDIEFYWADDNEKDNMKLDLSVPKS
jgi:hypothetical protein